MRDTGEQALTGEKPVSPPCKYGHGSARLIPTGVTQFDGVAIAECMTNAGFPCAETGVTGFAEMES